MPDTRASCGRSATRALVRLVLALTAMIGFAGAALAGPAANDEADAAIRAGLDTIRTAALASDPARAADIFAADLVLVSQSGKVYGRDAALLDLRNGFEAWDNSDIILRYHDGQAVVVLINHRQRTGMDPTSFRVMQLWRRNESRWVIAAQSSVRLPHPE